MHDIICPHCGKAFKIDEAGYADILKQVRDSAFEQQLHERLELAEQDKRNAVELATARLTANCRSPPRQGTPRSRAEGQLDAGEVARKLAVAEALSAVEKQRDALANELEQAKRQAVRGPAGRGERWRTNCRKPPLAKDAEIQGLKARLDAIELSQKLAITEAVARREGARRTEEPGWRGHA
jgi:hypothetical protein